MRDEGGARGAEWGTVGGKRRREGEIGEGG